MGMRGIRAGSYNAPRAAKSQHAKNVEPAIKERCKQHDDNDCTQDVVSAAAPLPRFNR
jgi:hypothetical protein